MIDASAAGHNQLLMFPQVLFAARKRYAQSHTGPLARSLWRIRSQSLKHRTPAARRITFQLKGQCSPEDLIIAIEGLCQTVQCKGSLTLKSSDPRNLPIIDPAYCTDPYDWKITIETIRLQLRIAASPTMEGIIRKVFHDPEERQEDGSVELCEPDDDDSIRKYLRREELTQGFHRVEYGGKGRRRGEGGKCRFQNVGFDGIENHNKPVT